MNARRARILKRGNKNIGPIVYWMSRDQRVQDNWALLFAQEMALRQNVPLAVVFCLAPEFLGATIRQYVFMLKGLQEVERSLVKMNVPFYLFLGEPTEKVPNFLSDLDVQVLVTDFSPLHLKKDWNKNVAANISIPFYEVDAHNIVPCWLGSPKQEYAAHGFRPKIKRALPEFLEEFPPFRKHPNSWKEEIEEIDWNRLFKELKVDTSIPEVHWLKPGMSAAYTALQEFMTKKLETYAEKRNDPSRDGQSDLSSYLHFGQLSAQRAALEVLKTDSSKMSKATFLEELIVRRELSDNFCSYNVDYDNFYGFPDWAKNTLNAHRKDRRMYNYSVREFEHARTHDDLWNASQIEMVKRGKMHGYMRMYWAKKILEWTEAPEEAMKIAIYLNDKYELDGRDPNGYTGIGWSIGGVHDRPWKERAIFGKIRYMSYDGCKSKFDIKKYIKRIGLLEE